MKNKADEANYMKVTVKKKKAKRIAVVIVLLCCFLAGGVGVWFTVNTKEDASGIAPSDLLVGVFLTTESDKNTDVKHYATLVHETKENGAEIDQYVFESLEGYGCYYFLINEDGKKTVISDRVDYIDGVISDYSLYYGIKSTLEVTVHYSEAVNSLYINPVYQSLDGSVYTIIGEHAEHINGGTGSDFTQKLSDDGWVYKNGKVTKRSTELNLTVKYTDAIAEKEVKK